MLRIKFYIKAVKESVLRRQFIGLTLYETIYFQKNLECYQYVTAYYVSN